MVVQGFINRIREVNPLINSVVDERYELALKEARDADAFLASTTLSAAELKLQKPFLGVPFTTKDSTAVKGLFQTCAPSHFQITYILTELRGSLPTLKFTNSMIQSYFSLHFIFYKIDLYNLCLFLSLPS